MNISKWIDFFKDYWTFRNQAKRFPDPFVSIKLNPYLGDKSKSIEAWGHYFHQDLLIAQKIFLKNPVKHVDVGSRMDGLVAHVASFREIEVIDIRPLEIDIPNVHFIQDDLTRRDFNMKGYCDSLSSLHAIEHFGLGRYGDVIDFNGYLRGIEMLDDMLVVGGKLYFSVPIGSQHIEFNAHRVFSLPFILELFRDYYTLDSFSYVDDHGNLVKDPALESHAVENSFSCQYGCGIFELTKIKEDIPLFGKQRIGLSRSCTTTEARQRKGFWLIGALADRVLWPNGHHPIGSATRREDRLIKDLKEKTQKLESIGKPLTCATGQEWADKLERLKRLVLEGNPEEFLTWDVIQETMFVTKGAYINEELNYLRRNQNWDIKWRRAIEEVAVGYPVLYQGYPDSSANLIHHAYHICQFEKKTGKDVRNMDLIFEFGGGYGSMCRLLHNLGFQGTYIIFDLAPFSLLQQYYLQALGLSVYDKHTLQHEGKGVFCLSDLQELKEIFLEFQKRMEKTLVIGTWSISEAPLDLRREIISLVSESDFFLFAYQDLFSGIDNRQYFETVKKDMSFVDWEEWAIDHLPENYYLMGKRASS